MVKIWSEWNVARLVLPVSAIVVLFWTAGLWTDNSINEQQCALLTHHGHSSSSSNLIIIPL